MRCESCNKFVSYDEPNVDDIEVEIVGNSLSVSGVITLCCADCGSELSQAEISDEVSLDQLIENYDTLVKLDEDNEEIEFELVDHECNPHERLQDTDQNGRKIRSARYMKMYRGVTVSGTLKLGEDAFEFSHDFEVQASEFESIQ